MVGAGFEPECPAAVGFSPAIPHLESTRRANGRSALPGASCLPARPESRPLIRARALAERGLSGRIPSGLRQGCFGSAHARGHPRPVLRTLLRFIRYSSSCHGPTSSRQTRIRFWKGHSKTYSNESMTSSGPKEGDTPAQIGPESSSFMAVFHRIGRSSYRRRTFGPILACSRRS